MFGSVTLRSWGTRLLLHDSSRSNRTVPTIFISLLTNLGDHLLDGGDDDIRLVDLDVVTRVRDDLLPAVRR